MQHFPIFLSLTGRRVVVSGGGQAAIAKLRLLLKTEARLIVLAADPAPEIAAWADAGRLTLHRRDLAPGDAQGAALVYAADEDEAQDARTVAIAHVGGALVNVVDDLYRSDFITPAIVDRDPVTVAIGTEGAAPVLARAIKADLEERLPASLGALARIGRAFRRAADALPMGRARRAFWAEWYDRAGPRAIARGEDAAKGALDALLHRHLDVRAEPGSVAFVGAGPGDPDLMTLRARRLLSEADVVIHDRLVPGPILELARREAVVIEAGKTGFGPSTPQAEVEALTLRHASEGARVVRLKSGDPGVFGRLDEEVAACEAAGVAHAVVPGVTAASAAAASLGRSLTRRGRNAELRVITGHDARGFAEHDWRALARPGAVAAIYMGLRAARFLQGRLMMHGADAGTPVTVVENAGRPAERRLDATLGTLGAAIEAAGLRGPAVILLGIAARGAALPILDQEVAL